MAYIGVLSTGGEKALARTDTQKSRRWLEEPGLYLDRMSAILRHVFSEDHD